MSCGCTACQEALTLDPWKRVRYAHGLVLGVEERAISIKHHSLQPSGQR